MIDRADQDELEDADTLVDFDGETKSSARILAALRKAEDATRDYQDTCDQIDKEYGRDDLIEKASSYAYSGWADPEFDLFWSSTEILKPAIYAKPPKPTVSPEFGDRKPLLATTSELLERASSSAFKRGNIDEVMLGVRDDLIFYNRGQIWVGYETDEKGGGQRIPFDHLDRKDFLHPTARKWSDVPWVARAAWMTKGELRARFYKHSGDAYQTANLERVKAGGDTSNSGTKKAQVWEVWHKADNKVYWVAKGVPVLLDSGLPHLKLEGFFPCPRPAYGTLKPRTLMPVPDWLRYRGHFNKINELTRRIHTLLSNVKMKGLVPAGGDIANAIHQALREGDESLVIGVPSAALASVGPNGFVSWMPLKELAEAIQGLIAARGQLIEDFYQLSGISDIMRGATDAEETLGAQRMKSQYGSVRVREKIDELQRIACDVVKIAAEIMADKFKPDTLLEMAQMEIPTKADIDKRVKEIEDSAKNEMKALEKQALAALQQNPEMQAQLQQNPGMVEQHVKQAQQPVLQKYGKQLDEVENLVPMDAVMKLLRDDRARGFAFEIATDSTILIDEMQEKASRNELLDVFSKASAGLMGLAGMGPQGAKLAGAMLKNTLQPYKIGRELDTIIEEFIEAAPEMAAAQNKNGNSEAEAALVQAQNKLADAEIMKAQAQTAKVQAEAETKMHDMQRKFGEAQAKATENERRFAIEVESLKADLANTNAATEKLRAETQAILAKMGNEERKTNIDEFKAVSDAQAKSADQQQRAVDSERNAQQAARQQDYAEISGDRQQSFTERQGERSETRADRQQDFSERQAQQEPA